MKRKLFVLTRGHAAEVAVLLINKTPVKEVQQYLEQKGYPVAPSTAKYIKRRIFKGAKTNEDFLNAFLSFIPKNERLMGKKNPMWGKHHTKETKEKIGKKLKGRTPWNKGISHSEETKDKISEKLEGKFAGEKNPMYGKHHTEETRDKMSQKKLGTWAGDNNPNYNGTSRTAETRYVSDLGHKIRSSWEEEICRALLESGIEYDYEETVSLGDKKFVVDIHLKNTDRYIEIKGRINEEDIEKMRLFKKLYPERKLIVVTKRSAIQENKIPQDCYDEIYDVVTVTVPQLCGVKEEVDEEVPF